MSFLEQEFVFLTLKHPSPTPPKKGKLLVSKLIHVRPYLLGSATVVIFIWGKTWKSFPPKQLVNFCLMINHGRYIHCEEYFIFFFKDWFSFQFSLITLKMCYLSDKLTIKNVSETKTIIKVHIEICNSSK